MGWFILGHIFSIILPIINILDDLDAAMTLMAKVADLYPRLEKKKQGILLQILVKQIIVDPHGKIVEHELNSPFVYLRSLVQNLSTPAAGKVVRNISAQGYFSQIVLEKRPEGLGS